LSENEVNERTETALENKNPATPDQEVRINELATTMAASTTSFSTE
jgi:hypothetical protein